MKIPATPPSWRDVLRADPAPLWLMADVPSQDGYPHWDDLVGQEPPEGLTHEQWWVRLKALRLERAVKMPVFRTASGKRFWYCLPEYLSDIIAQITPAVSGADADLGRQINEAATHDMFAEWTLREEAIASAQIAGAELSRSEALLRFDNGTLADTVAGGIAWRNYVAMARMHELADQPLTPELVIELNTILTGDGTLRTSDDTDISDPTGRVWHSAPPASEVPKRLEKLCRFANQETDEQMPPLLAAMTVHYMAVHDHYFAQANQRTARLLFYWALNRCDYRLARYLSISKVMAAKGVNYRRTFLLTDTDDGDLTYFFAFQLSVLRRAIWQLRARLETELAASNPTLTPLLSVERDLNHRQLTVLETCLADPRSAFSYDTHAAYWDVTFETARTDLRSLGKRGLMVRKENSRVWQAPDDLLARLRGDAPPIVALGDAIRPTVTPTTAEGSLSKLWRFVRSIQPGRD